MLIATVKMLPEKVDVEVNLETVCILKDAPGVKKGTIDKETCVLGLANGLVLHVDKSRAEISKMMRGYK